MDNYQGLKSHGLFVLKEDEKIVLYAPLTGMIAELHENEAMEYDRLLSSGVVPSALKPWIDRKGFSGVVSPEDTDELTVLINQRCNFSCKYCYSANGRSVAELDERLYRPLADWFVRKERLSRSGSDCLKVVFSGGGDPTLSFGKIKTFVAVFKAKAKEENIGISFGMVCNGSKIRHEDVDFIRDNFDNIVISFDVIPEVHNSQRSHYEIVADTMCFLASYGISFGIRCTVTDLNVSRLEEMIEYLHDNFPFCREIAAEAVLAPSLWKDIEQLSSFYSKFRDNFFRAQRKGRKYGIVLGNTIEQSYHGLKSRACEGKVVVTPMGKLTACSRVATSGDSHYNDFVFGEITESGVTYDSKKYNEMMSVRAESFEECKFCFAKYHCGGGCMLMRLSYSPGQMKLHCDFTRGIIKKRLFYELDK